MLLETRNVQVRYGPAKAVNGVSIEVRGGAITALIGPNGAGKSSLLKAICGLVPLADGEVRLAAEPISRLSPGAIAARGVALVPEGRRIFAKMTTEENLRLGGYLLRSEQRTRAALEAVFELFPRLRDRRTQRAGTLSGGEQQMLAIGRALMAGPKLIMADEVSQGLAPVIVQEVYRQLARVAASGVGVLMVEQNARLAFNLAEFIYVMRQGQIAVSGAASDLAASTEVRKVYLGSV